MTGCLLIFSETLWEIKLKNSYDIAPPLKNYLLSFLKLLTLVLCKIDFLLKIFFLNVFWDCLAIRNALPESLGPPPQHAKWRITSCKEPSGGLMNSDLSRKLIREENWRDHSMEHNEFFCSIYELNCFGENNMLCTTIIDDWHKVWKSFS